MSHENVIQNIAVLRRPCVEIAPHLIHTPTIQELISSMMRMVNLDPNAWGLAANQLPIPDQLQPLRIFVTRFGDPEVFINPKITLVSMKTTNELVEGCLSLPGKWGRVRRYLEVGVEALDANGIPFQVEARGLRAVLLQHEIDHLNGALFTDKLTGASRFWKFLPWL